MGRAAARIRLLDTMVGYVGSERIARALAIEPRSLRAKLSADRGITDTDLRLAARCTADRAHELLTHAGRVRDHLGDPQEQP